MKTITYRIPTWALTALINDDYSGLAESDCEQLDKFCDSLNQAGYYGAPCSWVDVDFCYFNDMDKFGSDCHLMIVRPG